MTPRATDDWIAIARSIRNIETLVRIQTEMLSQVFKQQQDEIARLEHKLAAQEDPDT